MRRAERDHRAACASPLDKGDRSLPRETGEGTGTRWAFLAAITLTCVLFPAATHAVITTTTKYTYNADGELTAITRATAESTQTTYVTWDNFVPDANDPSKGTVMTGNGTLVSFGPSPGLPAQFQFDARQRLTGYTDGNLAESVDYRANGTLGSTEAAGDARQFYFDDSRYAEIMNIHENGQDLWSAHLEGVRYLSDGAEQVLLKPRKDVACTYDAQGQTLQSYVYDVYGAQSQVAPQSSYDLRDNPMQYAGEYRDPLWGGYYLRARWYDPDLPIFLSRDPLPHLNRYGYAGGNAVMRTDPSGMGFFGEIEKGLRAVNKVMNKGVFGHFARFFLSPVMGALQIAAYPKEFWENIKHDRNGIDIFLAAGIATEGLSIGLERIGLSAIIRNVGYKVRFGLRIGIDLGLGVGQAVAAGASRGVHHFNWDSFAQNLELAAGGLVYSHVLVGYGFNPYALRSGDVLDRLRKADNDTVLIFRERTQGNSLKTFTSPAMEALGIGRYHERIIAITNDYSVSTELGLPREGYGWVKTSKVEGVSRVQSFLRRDRAARYQFVGKVSRDSFSPAAFTRLNPRGLLSGAEFQQRLIDDNWSLSPQTAKYKRWTNNCHAHATGVLNMLEFQ
jgi:RHS repeat-associated protein